MSLLRFFRRKSWDRHRLEEIESYIQIETDENRARGMSDDEARAAAQRKFGNSTRIREEIYDMNTIRLLDTLLRDTKYGFRALRHNLVFTVVAVLTLATGIGANAAVFSVVNSVLLRPLRYPKPDELVSLRQVAPGAPGLASFSNGLPLSPSMYFTYAEQNRAFQSLGVWLPGTANVTGIGEPERVRVVYVSDGTLQAFAVPAAAGRWLSSSDQIPRRTQSPGLVGEPTTVMLSYGYWQRHFGGNLAVIGRTITVDSGPQVIVGVMPEGFRFLNTDSDLIMPVAFDRGRTILAGFAFQGIARLKPGVTIGQANADISRMLPIWMDSWSNGPGTNGRLIYERWKITPAVRLLQEEIVGDVREVLWVVMGTIGLVLLIACANVTNLMLVRAEVRQQELGLRSALGANRAQIAGSLMVESTILGLMGGVLGIALAYGALRLLAIFGPVNLPRLAEISIDPRTLVFTLLLSVVSAFAFGLIPVVKYTTPRISAVLGVSGRTASASRARHRTRNFLVIAQVSVALVLLVSVGLMIRTFQALRSVDPGFTRADHLQTMRIAIPDSLVAEPQRVIRIQNDIVEKLAAIPGVTSAGFATEMPMEGIESNWDSVFAEDKTYRDGEFPPLRFYKYVSPDFFRTSGTQIIAGRELTWNEVYSGRPVVMVSENLARELWGSPSAALGKRLRQWSGMPWHEVVGVVRDVRERGVNEKAPTIVYWPPADEGIPWTRAATFVIRSDRAGTEAFLGEVRRTVWSANPNLPVAATRTMQEIYDQSLAQTSFALVMLAIAAVMALALGIIGIYGVIAYAVSQRRREIGIRLALGAQQRELKRMFIRHAFLLATIGIGLGLVASAGLTRLMRSLLFEISPTDPVAYSAAPVVLIVAALLASYIPARRAARMDPVETLRLE
jgi:predicted permease